jgi:galactonate dehydratase
VGSVREIVGDDFGIGIDFHGRVHKSMAKVLIKELEPFHPMFVEEPVLPENNEVLKILANSSSIPIATGERMYSRWDYKKLLTDGTADIIQPDLSHAGGITETKKIISMAEAFDVAAAPHCPLGPIALASSLQVGATCHNVFIQEQSLKMHYNKGNDLLDYLKNKNIFKYNNGFVPLPEQPGLGVDIDEDFVRQESKKWKPWRNPVWRNEDGSVAEW